MTEYRNIVGSAEFAANAFASDGASLSPISTARRVDTLKIAVFGDSTADIGDQTTPANNDTSLFIYAPATSANVAVSKTMAGAGVEASYPVAQFVTNCGVGGRSVATMVSGETGASSSSSRKAIDCSNNDPDVIIYRGGSINDLTGFTYTGGVVNETSYQTMVTNHKTVLHRLITLGAVVLDCGIYGYNLGMTGFPATSVGTDPTGNYIRAAIVRFNAEIKAYIASLNNPRVIFIDPDGVISDAGVIRTGYTLLTDGKHLNGYGGYIQGIAEKSALETIFGKSRKYRYQGKNLQYNPLFADNSSGLPTGYAAGSLTNATHISHEVTDVDGDIWWLRTVKSNAAGTVTIGLNIPFNPTASGTNPLDVQVGDVYGFEFDLSIENLTTGVINEVKRARSRMTLYNAANTFFVYSDFMLIDDTSDTGSQHSGKLTFHAAHTPIQFNDAAASWGSSTTCAISVSTVALGVGEQIRVGISNPRIVKLA